jgi:sulfatase maturation enzyme AslB (radical SAM superfamily)
MKIRVHYNFHKKLFSIVSREKKNYGKVIQHTNNFAIFDARFHVSEKGRRRVLKERCKNVHAYCSGVSKKNNYTITSLAEITYNPYKYKTFVSKENPSIPIYESNTVIIKDGKIYAEL